MEEFWYVWWGWPVRGGSGGGGRAEGRAAAAGEEDLPGVRPDQMLLLPPSLDERLPEDHLARFVAELVDEVLNLGPILASCTERRGSLRTIRG
jgi:hypothetical protein